MSALTQGPGCGDGANGAGPPAPSTVVGPTIRRIVLEVDYAEGAEPEVGQTAQGAEVWGMFRKNAEALFADTGKAIEAPTRLDQMQALGALGPGPFDSSAILDLAGRHRDAASGGDTAAYYAVWLDGFYAEGGETRADVLGVSIGDTGVIAMFKPVVRGAAQLEVVRRFVEQSTLVHEFGHAVGLVDNGVAPQSAHHDAEHGAHCTNREGCVMYYANEGVADMIAFYQRNVLANGDASLFEAVLFGPECLADMAAAAK